MKPNVLWTAVLLVVVYGYNQESLLAAQANKARGAARAAGDQKARGGGRQGMLPVPKIEGEDFRRQLLEKSRLEAKAMMKSGKWGNKKGMAKKRETRRAGGAGAEKPRTYKKRFFQSKSIESDLLAVHQDMRGKRPKFIPDPEFGTRGRKGREMSDAVKGYAEPKRGDADQRGSRGPGRSDRSADAKDRGQAGKDRDRKAAPASKYAMQKDAAGHQGMN